MRYQKRKLRCDGVGLCEEFLKSISPDTVSEHTEILLRNLGDKLDRMVFMKKDSELLELFQNIKHKQLPDDQGSIGNLFQSLIHHKGDHLDWFREFNIISHSDSDSDMQKLGNFLGEQFDNLIDEIENNIKNAGSVVGELSNKSGSLGKVA